MKKFFLKLAITFLWLLFAFIGLSYLWSPSGAVSQNIELVLMKPNWTHIFGTDSLGRDLFLRVLVGGRISLMIGLVSAVLSSLFGFIYGAFAGWCEGRIDKILMRASELFMAVPSFVLVAVLCVTLESLMPFENPDVKIFVGLCFGISATHWMSLARVTRGLVLEYKRRPFVEAAIALGGTRRHIVIYHILPNIKKTLLILVALQIPTTILYESFMSFVGLGVHPPFASWGILVRDGWKSLSSFPHLLLFPSLVLFLTVWSFHIVLDWFGKRADHRI
jgi:oligopeptide transport system permease protein